jgi:arginine decarboxylase
MQSYQEFLDLSVGFPQEGFEIIDDELYFHDLNLMEMIETYGTPLRFTYLPMITKKFNRLNCCFSRLLSKTITAAAINIAIAPKARTLSTL